MDTNTPADTPAPVTLLEWSAPVRPHANRSPRWYAIGGAVVLTGAAYSIITGAWSLAIVILLCGGLYFLIRDHVPELKRIQMREDGLTFDTEDLSWSECKDFWIISSPRGNELHITRTARLKPQIILQTGDIALPVLRTVLSRFLKEQADRQESLIDTISRLCKL